jgi:hypothetical protein
LLEFYRYVQRREVMTMQAMARGSRDDRWIIEYDTEYYEARSMDGRVSMGGPVSAMLSMLKSQGIRIVNFGVNAAKINNGL